MDRNATYEEKVTYITRFLAGEMKEADEAAFRKWLEDEDNAVLFEDYRKVWEGMDQVAGTTQQEVDEAWSKVDKAISTRPAGSKYWIAVAASVLVAILAAVFFLIPGGETYRTTRTAQEINLPDGTLVTLNANSSLSYDADYGNQDRSVILEGEGFFDVVRDTLHPFRIEAGEAVIEVLGTSFNVNAYAEKEEVIVVVQSGSVRVSASGGSTTLAKGQQAVYDRNTGVLNSGENQNVNYLAWKTREIILEDLSLKTVVGLLENIYQVSITLDPSSLENCTVTATFRGKTADQVVEVIAATLGLEINKTKNGYRLVGEGC